MDDERERNDWQQIHRERDQKWSNLAWDGWKMGKKAMNEPGMDGGEVASRKKTRAVCNGAQILGKSRRCFEA